MYMIYRLNKYHSLSSVILAISPLILLLYGCGTRHYINPNVSVENVKRIAVLPFENFTEYKFADERVRSAVIIELLSRGFEVIEPGEVTRVLRELGIRSPARVSTPDITQIGEALGVESVMKGSVGTYDISQGISVTFPEVSIHLMLIDAPSGDILWYVWNSAGGPSFWTRHFGSEAKTLDETTADVVKKAVDTLQ
jgi:TolB-like protein